jgi:hypothetical protein
MFFGKPNSRVKEGKSMHPIVFLPVFIAILIVISNCAGQKGNIVIVKNPDMTRFTMNLKDWSAKNKYELSLNSGDVLQIEIERESGEIGLIITSKNGAEPYRGNISESITFTVTVSETDKYTAQITGKKATGKITVKKIIEN